jgi:hypothetical protein
MSGIRPLLPLYAFMEWTGMTVPLFLRAPQFCCCLKCTLQLLQLLLSLQQQDSRPRDRGC